MTTTPETKQAKLPDPSDAPRDKNWSIAYCRDAFGIVLTNPDFAHVKGELLSLLGVSEGFALQAVETLDADYPNLSPDESEMEACDTCGCEITADEYSSGQGLCTDCINAVN